MHHVDAGDEVVDRARLDDDPPVAEPVAHVAHGGLGGRPGALGAGVVCAPGEVVLGGVALEVGGVGLGAGVPGAGSSGVARSCSSSACISAKGWPAGGLKHTPAVRSGRGPPSPAG